MPDRPVALRRALGAACMVAVVAAAAVSLKSETTGQARTSRLLFTADGQGKVTVCLRCPAKNGLGGFARRATFLKRQRAEHSALLLLDAGNALFGTDSMLSEGRVVAEGYAALGYDAVNISYRDFRLGKAKTLALKREARFAMVSANVLDERTGKPLFEPFVVNRVGGKRIAVVGVTEAPLGLDLLPHLKRQLAGVRIGPPADALAACLPKARAAADRVVLLYYGSMDGLRPIRERFGEGLAAICVGGIRPRQVAGISRPPVAAVDEYGREVTQVDLPPMGSTEPPCVMPVAMSADLQPDDAMEALIRRSVPLPGTTTRRASPATRDELRGSPAVHGARQSVPYETCERGCG